MSCPTKVQAALKKLDWIDSATMGASRVSTLVWFKTKKEAKFDEEALKGAIAKAGSNYSFAGVVKYPSGSGAATSSEQPSPSAKDPGTNPAK